MPKVPRFEVKKTARGWKLNIPASISDTGKKQELYFDSRDKATIEAQKRRGEYRANGERATVLPPRVADDALRAWIMLEPLGISLTEVARDHVAKADRLARSVKVAAALVAWKKAKEMKRARTKGGYAQTAEKLKKALGNRILASVQPEELAAAITAGTASSYAAHRRNASAFWHWCAKPPRKWCRVEDFKDVETVELSNDEDITVLSAKLVKLLLRTAEKHYPETVPIYAVGFFGGARVEELKRLTGDEFDIEGIEISAAIAKKRRRRHIPMSDTLAAWLEAYPFAPCPDWKRRHNAVRRMAGWDVVAEKIKPEVLEKLGTAKLGRWPRNVIRHTHASAEIASGASVQDLLFRFGHTESLETLRSHYVGRMTKKEALEIMAIGPNGTTVPLVKVA